VAAGPVPIPIALSILGQLCDALDYAHNLCDEDGRPLNIVHRDVSPSNIIISTTGVAKLIDFGIAKAAGSENTKTGYVKGKFAYMAPEYLLGQLDLRADLFGLGVIAHEMLAGRSLFLAKNDYDTMTRLREMPVQPPSRWNPDVPRDLDDIVLTALQRSPELRWQSAAAMRTAIANVVHVCGGPVTNQQVLEWIEWAFKREPAEMTTSLGRVIEQLDQPSRVTGEPGGAPDEPGELGGAPGELDAVSAAALTSLERPPIEPARPREPSGARSRAKPPTARSILRPQAPAAPRSSGRAWRLLLVLIVLAVLTRDQLEVTGRAFYDWVAG
jgi:serine/threonine-protein kinase